MTAHFNSISEAPLVDVEISARGSVPRQGVYRTFGKRMLDTVIVALAAPFVLLLITILSLPILLQGKSPFYTQRRIGLNGREFTLFKLKSMVCDADERLAHYLRENPAARDEWARKQKLNDDPRITAYGRFLRRTSLDELPQFLNVLRGEMSLIGPRPMMPHQRPLYHGAAYYRLRPGISGLWQVSDRNESEFVSRVRYDELYDSRMSLPLDLWVLVRTVGAVLRGTGV